MHSHSDSYAPFADTFNPSAALVHTALKPPEAEVTQYAVQYISVRSWGILAAMLGFVASGTYRGVKDTRTPLSAAAGAALTHVVLTPLFILGEAPVWKSSSSASCQGLLQYCGSFWSWTWSWTCWKGRQLQLDICHIGLL